MAAAADNKASSAAAADNMPATAASNWDSRIEEGGTIEVNKDLVCKTDIV